MSPALAGGFLTTAPPGKPEATLSNDLLPLTFIVIHTLKARKTNSVTVATVTLSIYSVIEYSAKIFKYIISVNSHMNTVGLGFYYPGFME